MVCPYHFSGRLRWGCSGIECMHEWCICMCMCMCMCVSWRSGVARRDTGCTSRLGEGMCAKGSVRSVLEQREADSIEYCF